MKPASEPDETGDEFHNQSTRVMQDELIRSLADRTRQDEAAAPAAPEAVPEAPASPELKSTDQWFALGEEQSAAATAAVAAEAVVAEPAAPKKEPPAGPSRWAALWRAKVVAPAVIVVAASTIGLSFHWARRSAAVPLVVKPSAEVVKPSAEAMKPWADVPAPVAPAAPVAPVAPAANDTTASAAPPPPATSPTTSATTATTGHTRTKSSRSKHRVASRR